MNTEAKPICAILVHVADVARALDWYQAAFPQSVRRHLEAFEFQFLDIGGICLEIVAADEKVGSGASGSVVYWQVDDFDAAVEHFTAIGATLYRGPIDIQSGLRMCQVRDPWGNCIGLRG